MKDEIFFRDKLEDEWEANEVYAILSECDKDFEPPLSERGSTVQKTWEKKSGDGVRNYFNEVAKQHTLLLKREKKIISFAVSAFINANLRCVTRSRANSSSTEKGFVR